MRLADEIHRLKGENQKLIDDLKKQQSFTRKNVENFEAVKTQTLQLSNQSERKRAASVLISIIKNREKLKFSKAFIKLWAHSVIEKSKDFYQMINNGNSTKSLNPIGSDNSGSRV